ncbi:DUF6894 family protein [Microvirga pudoricolor]|uniref:DUF6894 family protein n=1 Tax=Microvirga pudoricolor TaxID=2778729 RepID=UPI00194E96C2|nr:hypothetical protein [Microvirga pudoricolor]MBM6595382.1 hypothetical protein [Microvirga pudoricolor]
MPRFYFHIRNGDAFEDTDPDGEDLFDLEDARAEALQVARDFCEDWPRANPGLAVEVVDEAGRTVLTVPFAVVVNPQSR